MSNEVQDLYMVGLTVALILVTGIAIFLLVLHLQMRRELKTLKRGHYKASDLEDAERDEQGRPRLTLVKAWFGLAAIAGLARWIARSGGHPVASAVVLVTVGVATTAVVLLPETREMEPQTAAPPITATRTPAQHPDARGPTEPPAESETTTLAPQTSAPPTSTTRAPTTAPPTTARPSGTPSPSTVNSPPVQLDATVTAAPVPVDATPLDGGKPDKPDKTKGKPAAMASAAMASASDSTPPPAQLHMPCVQLLGVIELGGCGI